VTFQEGANREEIATMKPTRFGQQPCRALLREKGWSILQAAQEIGVTYPQLHYAMNGTTRPRPDVRERLPELLGVPLEELFTPEALEPYGQFGPRPMRGNR
jgi:transcriptional regulator with XRE-family HTH domain